MFLCLGGVTEGWGEGGYWFKSVSLIKRENNQYNYFKLCKNKRNTFWASGIVNKNKTLRTLWKWITGRSEWDFEILRLLRFIYDLRKSINGTYETKDKQWPVLVLQVWMLCQNPLTLVCAHPRFFYWWTRQVSSEFDLIFKTQNKMLNMIKHKVTKLLKKEKKILIPTLKPTIFYTRVLTCWTFKRYLHRCKR